MNFSLAKRLLRGNRNKGFTLGDYVLAMISNPKFVWSALAYKARQSSRRVESGLKASQNTALRAPKPFARTLSVDIEDLLAALSQHMGVLRLGDDSKVTSIGVADTDAISALVLLGRNLPEFDFRADGKPVNFGTRHFKSRALRAKLLTLGYNDTNLERRKLSIEVYRYVEPEVWLSQNDRNLVLRKLYSNLLQIPGLYEAGDILGAPTLHQAAADRPIDVVYTWVNHDDPDWQLLYRAAETERQGLAADKMSPDSTSLSRFHNKDELKFSMRSIHRNLPWVRRIFVFTNCAPPDWLDAGDDRIVWVRHEDVIPDRYLPVFNSHVIESYLHRIPDLAETFLYFNDDFFVMKSLGKKHFFQENGISRAQLEPYAMVSGPIRIGDPDYLNAARNSAALLVSAFDHRPVQLHRHVPYALLKSVLFEIEERFGDAISVCRGNRFRQSTDINIPSFLYHHYSLATRLATISSCRSVLAKSNDIRWGARLREAAQPDCEILCINDGGDLNTSGLWERSVTEFLTKHFADPAPWER